MNPEDIPLRDIHLPDPVSWWPLAPGWWLLAAIVFFAAVYTTWHFAWHRSRHRRAAKRELRRLEKNYAKDGDASGLLQGLSTLMRRAALTKVDRAEVAALQGEDWLGWLDQGMPDRPFTSGAGKLLASGPYQAPEKITANRSVAELVVLCRRRLEAMRL